MHRVRSEKTFFLFDKALLVTKKRGGHFVYKGHIPVTRPHLLLPCSPPSQWAGSTFQLCTRLDWASGWAGRSSAFRRILTLPPLMALRGGVPSWLPARGLTAVSPALPVFLPDADRKYPRVPLLHRHALQARQATVQHPGEGRARTAPDGPAGAGWEKTRPSLSGGRLGVSPRKAEVLGDISRACAEDLSPTAPPAFFLPLAPVGGSLAHTRWLQACHGNVLLLSWACPGQNGGGETEVDSPHQEAHSGQPPHHHPPEGEFPGRLMGSREWLSLRASSGEPWGLTFWTLAPLDNGVNSADAAVLCTSPVGGPGTARPREKWLIAR